MLTNIYKLMQCLLKVRGKSRLYIVADLIVFVENLHGFMYTNTIFSLHARTLQIIQLLSQAMHFHIFQNNEKV
jgi:hypothetical protein